MRTILLAVTVLLGSSGLAAAEGHDATKSSTAAATAVEAGKSPEVGKSSTPAAPAIAVEAGKSPEAEKPAAKVDGKSADPAKPARPAKSTRPFRRGIHLDKLELAKRERIRELFRDAQRRHGQPDNAVIDGLLPPLPGVLITPLPHGDARPYPFGILLTEPPRSAQRIVFVKRAPCQPRCSHELRRCGFIATPQDDSVPLWPWIPAVALGTAALILVARERRRALLETVP